MPEMMIGVTVGIGGGIALFLGLIMWADRA